MIWWRVWRDAASPSRARYRRDRALSSVSGALVLRVVELANRGDLHGVDQCCRRFVSIVHGVIHRSVNGLMQYDKVTHHPQARAGQPLGIKKTV